MLILFFLSSIIILSFTLEWRGMEEEGREGGQGGEGQEREREEGVTEGGDRGGRRRGGGRGGEGRMGEDVENKDTILNLQAYPIWVESSPLLPTLRTVRLH